MNRSIIISELEGLAPLVTDITMTMDMGYEFSAIVPGGVIYAEPGMLLDYSGGNWPPFDLDGLTEKELKEKWNTFLLDDCWYVSGWDELDDDELISMLEEAKNE